MSERNTDSGTSANDGKMLGSSETIRSNSITSHMITGDSKQSMWSRKISST